MTARRSSLRNFRLNAAGRAATSCLVMVLSLVPAFAETVYDAPAGQVDVPSTPSSERTEADRTTISDTVSTLMQQKLDAPAAAPLAPPLLVDEPLNTPAPTPFTSDPATIGDQVSTLLQEKYTNAAAVESTPSAVLPDAGAPTDIMPPSISADATPPQPFNPDPALVGDHVTSLMQQKYGDSTAQQTAASTVASILSDVGTANDVMPQPVAVMPMPHPVETDPAAIDDQVSTLMQQKYNDVLNHEDTPLPPPPVASFAHTSDNTVTRQPIPDAAVSAAFEANLAAIPNNVSSLMQQKYDNGNLVQQPPAPSVAQAMTPPVPQPAHFNADPATISTKISTLMQQKLHPAAPAQPLPVPASAPIVAANQKTASLPSAPVVVASAVPPAPLPAPPAPQAAAPSPPPPAPAPVPDVTPPAPAPVVDIPPPKPESETKLASADTAPAMPETKSASIDLPPEKAEDMPSKKFVSADTAAAGDVRPEVTHAWELQLQALEQENQALRQKLHKDVSDPLRDIEVDAVSNIHEDVLRSRIAELEKEMDKLNMKNDSELPEKTTPDKVDADKLNPPDGAPPPAPAKKKKAPSSKTVPMPPPPAEAQPQPVQVPESP